MTKRILYNNDDGSLVIITPSPEFLEKFTVEQVALKDVPFGKPYKIMDTVDIPTDRTFRNAWEVSDEYLTDGTGADYGVGSTKAVVDWNDNNEPVLKEIQ